MSASDATPLPIKNQAYRVTFPIFDSTGSLVTGATGLDSEVSKDGGAFADCTSEATEIATASGMYYLDLTSTEMDADTVAIIVKTSTSGAKTTPIVLYPEEAGDIRANMVQLGGSTQSATDLKDFADDGYDPATNKVQGVVLVDTSTTVTDKAGYSLSGTQTFNVTGSITGNLSGSVGSVTGAVGSVTGNVGGNVAGSVGSLTTNNDKTGYSLSAAGLQAIWDALTAALSTVNSIGKLLVDNVNATIGSRSSLSAADVNAEMVDALNVDTYAEPGQEAPPATTTLAVRLRYLYKAFRNPKTQTATTLSLYNDAGTVVDQKATISDDATTYTHGKIGTGP